MANEEKVRIEIVKTHTGMFIVINDFKICDPILYNDDICDVWEIDKKEIMKAINNEDY